MNERQMYALTHPITDPGNPAEIAKMEDALRAKRRHAKGQIILSILAVDR